VVANILTLRTARRLTYVELSARLTGIGWPIPVLGLRRIERGERRVDVDDLAALAEAFGVPMQRLLEEANCTACHGAPPAGFACLACGTEASR
jgi:transcriptional regulator with XRE-family HTH domain